MKGHGTAFSSMNSVRHTYNDRHEVTGDLIQRGGTATDTVPTDTTQATLGYTFDSIGNRSQITINAAATNYTRSTVNEYIAITGVSPAPVHDNDGNLTSAGGTSYQWDAENRLVRVDLGSGNNKIYYTYDYMGRRCRKTVKASNDSTILSDGKYIYEGWNVIAEYNLSGGTLTRQKVHYWGLDLSGSLQGAGGVGGLVATRLDVGTTGTFYTGYDPNGNVTEMFNSAGANVAHYEYDAFGKTINSAGAQVADFKMRFSTKFWDDESSLYYYGYRYYDPNHGRWLNRDPIGERGGLNLYAFVGNEPTNWVDVLGLAARKGFKTVDAAGIAASTEARNLTVQWLAANPPETWKTYERWKDRYGAGGITAGMEYCGEICCNSKDGLFYYTEPVEGRHPDDIEWIDGKPEANGMCAPSRSPCSALGEEYKTVSAWYHSHPSSRSFSGQGPRWGDIDYTNQEGIPGYVGRGSRHWFMKRIPQVDKIEPSPTGEGTGRYTRFRRDNGQPYNNSGEIY